MRTKQQIMKKTISLLAVVSFVTTAFLSSAVFAETFESEQGLVFTFNPTVSVSISGGTGSDSDGLTIDNLTPGDYKDSNIITVTASSNTPRGYTLASSVGSSTYAYTDLRKEVSDTTNKFTNLSGNKASLASFDPGTWGYSYSTDSGSTWISGDITSTTNFGYNGLPIYTTSSPITLINSSSPSETSIKFKIGAKANTSQLAGTYTNIVNFIGVGKVVTTNYTIDYNDPSSETTNMPSVPPDPQSAHSGTETEGTGAVQISSTVPVRANYFFKGWCTTSTTDDTCSGDTVQPGGYLALNPGTSSATATVTKTLYAMWKEDTKVLGYTTNYTGGEIASYEWTSNPPTTTAPTITKIEVPDGMHYHDGSQAKVYTKNAAAVVFLLNGVKYTRSTDSEGMAKLNINVPPGTRQIEMIAVEKNVQGDFGYAMASLPYTFTVLPAE